MAGRQVPNHELPGDLDGPFLGLDVGDARIGVSVSDATGLLARPLTTVDRLPKGACLDRIEALLRETKATGIVVGLPVLESGAEGEQAERTRAFVRSLHRRAPRIPCVWWDERYTSGEADDLMREHGERVGGRRSRARKTSRGNSTSRSRRDELAATILLQEWLDERRRRRQQDREKVKKETD